MFKDMGSDFAEVSIYEQGDLIEQISLSFWTLWEKILDRSELLESRHIWWTVHSINLDLDYLSKPLFFYFVYIFILIVSQYKNSISLVKQFLIENYVYI